MLVLFQSLGDGSKKALRLLASPDDIGDQLRSRPRLRRCWPFPESFEDRVLFDRRAQMLAHLLSKRHLPVAAVSVLSIGEVA